MRIDAEHCARQNSGTVQSGRLRPDRGAPLWARKTFSTNHFGEAMLIDPLAEASLTTKHGARQAV